MAMTQERKNHSRRKRNEGGSARLVCAAIGLTSVALFQVRQKAEARLIRPKTGERFH
jgi:ribosomal protein S26